MDNAWTKLLVVGAIILYFLFAGGVLAGGVWIVVKVLQATGVL
ncbi:hypothetical protein LCGC14_2905380 [marine sediment metagenome]|uniref:Uncharacterized protein n=1 Tax=marine sediment metagenome TaxID=412755 RepID=A0A0F8XTL8_9ZZZZ